MKISAKLSKDRIAKLKKDKKTPSEEIASITVDLGDNLKAMIDKSSEESTHKDALANRVVRAQGIIRTGLEAGQTAAEIQKTLNSWDPAARRQGKSKVERAKEDYEAMSNDDKAEFLAELGLGSDEE